MLEDEFKYFKENHEYLFEKYPNKYLVIQNKSVVETADSFEKALIAANHNGLELGTFLVQLCSKGEEGFTQSYHSRVIFA